MSFFDQMGGGASSMFGGGQASGLMGAGGGMNPQLMQLLMAMQNRQGQGQPGGGLPPGGMGAPLGAFAQQQQQAPMAQAMGGPQLPGAPQGLAAPSAGMMPHIPPAQLPQGGMLGPLSAFAQQSQQQQLPQRGFLQALMQMHPDMFRQMPPPGVGGVGNSNY